MALVYQGVHSRAFKWFPCIFPASRLHICSPGGGRRACRRGGGQRSARGQPPVWCHVHAGIVPLASPKAALPLPAL